MGKFSSIVPVMTLGSISKGWVVPGWRTGWLALHDLKGVFRTTKVLKSAKEYLEITSKPPTVIQAAILTILEKTPKEFFDKRQSFLKHKVDIGYSKLKQIPALTCYMKPEACTFLPRWTHCSLQTLKMIMSSAGSLLKKKTLLFYQGLRFEAKCIKVS